MQMDFESLGFRRYEGSLLEIRGNQLQSTVDQNMGNLCGSPSKDRDYEDHNGLDRKGNRAQKLMQVSASNHRSSIA